MLIHAQHCAMCALAAGERYMTAWLTLIGKGAPEVPVLDVELRRSGDELMGVTAKVRVACIRMCTLCAASHPVRHLLSCPDLQHLAIHHT